jgi:hypothetical protein
VRQLVVEIEHQQVDKYASERADEHGGREPYRRVERSWGR